MRPYDPQPCAGFMSAYEARDRWWRVTRPIQLALFDDSPWRRSSRWRLAKWARRHARSRLLLAGGILTDEQGRILLIHRATPGLSQWETPGGKVEQGESPADAAVRELAEELGIDAVIIADWGSHNIESGVPLTYALFEVKAIGQPRLVERQTFDQMRFFAWVELTAIEHELSANASNLLRMWRRGKLRPKPWETISA